jgi:hypothetical protein
MGDFISMRGHTLIYCNKACVEAKVFKQVNLYKGGNAIQDTKFVSTAPAMVAVDMTADA